MQQFVAQPTGVLSMTSSHSIHGGNEAKVMAASTSAGPGQLQAQLMFPVSVSVRPGLPRQVDPSHGQFMPAQVSSVNVNTGSNMATKGPMMRPMLPGDPTQLAHGHDTSSFVPMHHVMGMDGEVKPTNLPQKVRIMFNNVKLV